MTPAEAQMLLGVAASFDNRKPSEEAAIAWSHALNGIPFVDARDAVVAHYRTSTDWIMPAQIYTAVRRVRAKRIAEHPQLTPPPGLNDVQERRWFWEMRNRIANGETFEPDQFAGELVTGAQINFRALLPSPDDTTTPDAPTCSGDNEGASDA